MEIVFALIALVGWGVGDIFVTIASRKTGNLVANFWWLVFSLVLSLFYLPFAGKISDWNMILVAFGIHLIGNLGILLYFRALEIGNASLVGTIAGSFAAVTVPLSIVLFKENLNSFQLIGIIFILVGLVLASLRKDALNEIKSGKVFSDPGAGLALIIMILWGIFWTLIRIPVEKIGWYWAGLPGYFFFVVLYFMGNVKKEAVKVLKKKGLLAIFLLMAIFTTFANYAFNIGITFGYSSVVAPISGLSPVLFVIFAYFVFRDRLNGRQITGIVSSIIGIIILVVTSG